MKPRLRGPRRSSSPSTPRSSAAPAWAPIPEAQNPHKTIAAYAKDLDIVVFNGHVHTTELYEVDGVKYLLLGGGGAEQDPILPGRTHIKVPAGYPPDLYWKGAAPQGGVQLRARGREARTEDEVHAQSLPAVVGRAVRERGAVRRFEMKRCAMRFRFVLPLPRFVLQPLTAVVHRRRACLPGRRSPLGVVQLAIVQWTHLWKGFGALGGATCSRRWLRAAAAHREASDNSRACTSRHVLARAGP